MTTARTVRTVEKGDWKVVFLRELARGYQGAACKKAQVGRTTAYKTRDEDAEFAAAMGRCTGRCRRRHGRPRPGAGEKPAC